MAVIPKLVLDYPDYHIEIKRFYPAQNELIFVIYINGIDLCTAAWLPNSHWELRDCSITIEDMQDVILPALVKHIKQHAHGFYVAQGLHDDTVNKSMLFMEFKNVLRY